MKHLKFFRFAIILLILTAVAFVRWWFTYNQILTGIDDANIFFVYAKNLAEGNGLVYNAGGEPVEGFTSFLWVLILSLFYLAGPMEVITLFFNLLLLSYTFYRLTLFVDKLNSASENKNPLGFYSLIVLAFICLIPGYIDWTILTLMETGLWSTLLVLISLNLCQLFLEPENKKLSRSLLFLMPLLVLTRPESLAWGLVFIAIRGVQLLYFRHSIKESIHKVLPLFASYFVTLILLFVFRLSYFGYLLPNTYYAKMSGTPVENITDGFYYLLRYVKENPFIPVFVLGLIIALFLIMRRAINTRGKLQPVSLIQACIILITGLQFLIPLYTGGDHFYLSRFLQPLYPLLLLGFFNGRFWKEHGLKNFSLNNGQAAFVLTSLFLLILATTRFSFLGNSSIYKEFEIARMGRDTGNQLNAMFENTSAAYPSVGTYLAGGIAYAYKGHTVDLLGLNNTRMAHAPKENKDGYKNHSSFNKKVFYQIAPDILHIEFIDNLKDAKLTEQDSTDFQNQVYQFIFLEDSFRLLYEPVVISTPDRGLWYQAYVKKSYLRHLGNQNQKFYILNRKKNLQQVREELLLQLSYLKE